MTPDSVRILEAAKAALLGTDETLDGVEAECEVVLMTYDLAEYHRLSRSLRDALGVDGTTRKHDTGCSTRLSLSDQPLGWPTVIIHYIDRSTNGI